MKRETVLKHAPTLIIAAALLVSAPRLASALAFVEPPFLGLPIAIVTGPAFGLTTAGATVYVWHIYQERKRLSLAKFLLVGWCILLGLIALVLVPGMVVEVRASPLADLLRPPLDVAWCIALAISSEIVVGLVALASAIAEPAQKKKRISASNVQPTAKIVKVLTAKERREQLVGIWRQDGNETFTKLAPRFSVSRQTISNDFATLRKAGRVKRNGRGVEVIDKIAHP